VADAGARRHGVTAHEGDDGEVRDDRELTRKRMERSKTSGEV
jgi:hypothetical protein